MILQYIKLSALYRDPHTRGAQQRRYVCMAKTENHHSPACPPFKTKDKPAVIPAADPWKIPALPTKTPAAPEKVPEKVGV
jgi:hypothetical protein